MKPRQRLTLLIALGINILGVIIIYYLTTPMTQNLAKVEHELQEKLTKTSEDVSERLREQLREQKETLSREARFEAIFENAVLGIALVNHEQKIMQCNQALASILGYSTRELLNKNLRDFLPPDN